MASQSAQHCPRDGGLLQPLAFDSTTRVDLCPDCGGAFYERGELERALQHQELAADAMIDGGTKKRPGCTCPACGEQMTELTWPTWTEIRVDACPACGGRWLDRGELEGMKTALDAVSGRDDVPEVDFKEVRLEDGSVVVIPHRVATDGGIQWRWVVIGAALILVATLATRGVIGFFDLLDQMARDDGMDPGNAVVLATLLGFPLGGVLAGRASPGFTVVEPAIAAVPAAVLVMVSTQGVVGLPAAVGLTVAGLLLALGGAWVGERLST